MKRFSVYAVMVFLTLNLMGQNDEYEQYYRHISEHIANGRCEKAQRLYEIFKQESGKSDRDIEARIAQCLNSDNEGASLGNAQKQYNLGKKYENEGNYSEAVRLYREAAEQGDAAAQYVLGDMYYYGNYFGLSVTKDFSEAVRWYQKAAEQGYAAAQCDLGYMFRNGYGVPQDYSEAVKWYRKSAEQGDASAQFNLGNCYYYGHGVVQDENEAVLWYRKSAEQGNSNAQYRLGKCYVNGDGVPRNTGEALRLYRKSAEQGNSNAQYVLGYLYSKGDYGVSRDYNEAVHWYRKSAEQGNSYGQCGLGNMYLNGYGVSQNYGEAEKWYRKSAYQDNVSGQKSLGYMYMNGYGVNKDIEQARYWVERADEQEAIDVKRKLEEMDRIEHQKSSTSFKTSGSNVTLNVSGVEFKMVWVEGGTFTMGCTSEQGNDCYGDEKPAHSVTLSSYYMGETEVTQALWKAVMGTNPSYFKGDDLPVEQVSWNDVQEFIQRLNAATGRTFRLPTDAEWEYAARGGGKSRGYKYSGSNSIDEVAWYEGNSGDKTHPVKSKSANELDLYDMSGNVREWCTDWMEAYSSGSQTNPQGPTTGTYRVYRGGSARYSARQCRVSYRFISKPTYSFNSLGFRLVLGL